MNCSKHPLIIAATVVSFVLLHVECLSVDTGKSPSHDERVLDAISRVAIQLETFNLHYLTKLEDKFVSIAQTLANLDANVKQLQEKAQVWDIFRHHITSWSEHIKTSDQKIEILKKSLEILPVIENQLQNTDFKVQHVFEKSDLINEKVNELSKSLLEMRRGPTGKQKQSKDVKSAPKSWSQEDFEQTEILMRLSKIQKTLQNTCSSWRLGREVDGSKEPSVDGEDESTSTRTLLARINSQIEKLPVKEMRQSFHLSKKNEKTLEALANVISHVDERTIRIFDTSSYQFKKLMSCCKTAEHEVLTFTNNANTLLKRTEQSIKAVEASSSLVTGEKCVGRENPQIIDGDESNASGEVDEDVVDSSAYNQPTKTNCFQLTTGRSGVYTFSTERKLNENGRDFYQQYCEYSTEGKAWTIIQRRDNFDPPENFNRSWEEYKHGFGNLSRDFWLGNEFIHKLTFGRSMILRIVLEDFKDNHVWVEYGRFKVQSEQEKYKLMVDDYRGSIADSFLYHNTQAFSTFDRRQDKAASTTSCAQSMGSGWWFKDCAESNLNGVYHDEPLGSESRGYKGIFWEHWHGDYSLKASKMMIRPRDDWFSEPSDEDLIELHNDLTGQ